MDVPLFPSAPSRLYGVATSLSDVRDVDGEQEAATTTLEETRANDGGGVNIEESRHAAAATVSVVVSVLRGRRNELLLQRRRRLRLRQRQQQQQQHHRQNNTASSQLLHRQLQLRQNRLYDCRDTTTNRRRGCKNIVHPRRNISKDVQQSAVSRGDGIGIDNRNVIATRRRQLGVLTDLCAKMNDRREIDKREEGDDNDDDDDVVVVCVDGTPSVMPDETLTRMKNGTVHDTTKFTKNASVQTIVGIPLRLRVLPSLRDIVDESKEASPSTNAKKSSTFWRHMRFLGRLSLSQFGLLWLLTMWAMAGAAAFCATEGPREREQVVELKDMQRDLAVGLATELRQLRSEREEDMEPLWSNKVRQYVAKHEKLLLAAVSSGYGETNDGGQLWTFPGCVLFAVSLLTTLGFGAPVPRTNAGRTVAVVFAAIGIPAHFLLVMNLGILLAVRLQKFAISRRLKKDMTNTKESTIPCHSPPPVPKWVKVVPFICVGSYYILGMLCFGIARSRPLPASVLFPLDFTVAGGLSTTSGHVRIFYAIYLEGAVTIAALTVAVLRVSASQSLTNIGLKYGLLTEA